MVPPGNVNFGFQEHNKAILECRSRLRTLFSSATLTANEKTKIGTNLMQAMEQFTHLARYSAISCSTAATLLIAIVPRIGGVQ